MLILKIIGLLGLTCGIVFTALYLTDKEDFHVFKKPIPYVFIGGLILILLGSSFKIVPTGNTGVRTSFGQISSTPVSNGLAIKIPIVQSISLVNNKQVDRSYKGQIWGEASDKTACYADEIIVSYKINPEYSVYIYKNISKYDENLIPSALLNSAVKSAMVQLNSDVVTHRDKIEPLTKKYLESAIEEKYGVKVVDILKISINSMDFEESYNKAIADKQIARQNAEKQAIENQKNIDLALAEQEKAKAESETKKIKAQADAEAEIIAANADAEAYRIKSEAITDKLLKKWELDARQKHGWVTIQGANTIVTTDN